MVLTSVLIFLAFIIPAILFVLTLYRTMVLISPANRKMQPGSVWLLFIPLFNLVWQFIVVRKVSDSIRLEFARRGLPIEEEPGFLLGVVYCVLFSGGVFVSQVSDFGGLLTLSGMVCWIVYWIKVAQFKKTLQQLPPDYLADSLIFGNRP